MLWRQQASRSVVSLDPLADYLILGVGVGLAALAWLLLLLLLLQLLLLLLCGGVRWGDVKSALTYYFCTHLKEE